jgi:O-antigen/teichoic acid export membrane protein
MSQQFGRAALFRAAILTTGSTYITFVLGMLVSVVIARALGPDDFGRYAYVLWLSGILIMLANNGLNMTGTKFVSEALGRKEPEVAAQVHGWLLRKQLWCVLGVGLGFLLFAPFMEPAGWKGQMGVLIAMVEMAAVFKAVSMFNTSIAKGFGGFWIEAATNLVASVCNTVVAVVLALTSPSTMAFVTMYTLTNLIYLILSIWFTRRQGLKPSAHRPPAELLERMRPHLWWTVGLTAVTAIGSRSVETYLLNAWASAAEVGYFVIACNLTRGGVEMLAAGLSTVIMPVFGYAFGSGDRGRIRRVFEDAVRYYQFLGLIISGVGWFWADVLVMLLYGQKYAPVASAFRIIVVSSGVMLANAAASAVLSNSDNQRFRVIVTVLSVLITALVAVSLIPTYGLLGAASSQLVANVICTAVIVRGIKKYVGLDVPWVLMGRQYGATLLAVVIAYVPVLTAGPIVGAWLAGPVFVLALLLLSPWLGVWRTQELAQAAVFISRLPRQLGWMKRLIPSA